MSLCTLPFSYILRSLDDEDLERGRSEVEVGSWAACASVVADGRVVSSAGAASTLARPAALGTPARIPQGLQVRARPSARGKERSNEGDVEDAQNDFTCSGRL